MRKKIAILMLCIVAIFSMAAVANAAIFSSDYISVYYGEVIDCGNGKLGVNYSITGRGYMDKIGAKTVILQERDNALDDWRTIKTFTSDAYTGMLAENDTGHTYTVYYYGANTETYEYRAKIYFYSEKGGYDTREYITDII